MTYDKLYTYERTLTDYGTKERCKIMLIRKMDFKLKMNYFKNNKIKKSECI